MSLNFLSKCLNLMLIIYLLDLFKLSVKALPFCCFRNENLGTPGSGTKRKLRGGENQVSFVVRNDK